MSVCIYTAMRREPITVNIDGTLQTVYQGVNFCRAEMLERQKRSAGLTMARQAARTRRQLELAMAAWGKPTDDNPMPGPRFVVVVGMWYPREGCEVYQVPPGTRAWNDTKPCPGTRIGVLARRGNAWFCVPDPVAVANAGEYGTNDRAAAEASCPKCCDPRNETIAPGCPNH